MNSIENKIDDFVRFHTRDFDESHDINHAIAVRDNSFAIIETLMSKYDRLFIYAASMLHDVRDHKYSTCISEKKFNDFVHEIYPSQAKNILCVIKNISFSNQVKGKREKFDYPYSNYLIAVSDADRLEALGEVGLNRCIKYTVAKGGNIPDDVIKHCHEKLLKLLPDNFIVSEHARKLAQPLHRFIENYVEEQHSIPQDVSRR